MIVGFVTFENAEQLQSGVEVLLFVYLFVLRLFLSRYIGECCLIIC